MLRCRRLRPPISMNTSSRIEWPHACIGLPLTPDPDAFFFEFGKRGIQIHKHVEVDRALA